MSISRGAIAYIKRNKLRRINGQYNAIPFGMKRMQKYIPGIQRSTYTILTANSGIGKTKVLKNMWLLRPYTFLELNPTAGMRMHTIFFCLEESRQKFIHSIMVWKLWHDMNMRIPYKTLVSVTEILPDEAEKYIDDELLPWLDKFEENVTIVDNVFHPYGIFMRCKEFLETQGTWTRVPYEFTDDQGRTQQGEKKVDYIPNDPDMYVNIIIDNYNALHTEKGKDLFESIRMLSGVYVTELRDKYGCAVTAGQQQSAEIEKQQYTNGGKSIESKLEPTLQGLGDCKLSARNADEIYGLFAPDRYEIKDHRGNDITLLEDNYRSLSFLKTRDGEANYRLPLFFDGATGHVEELPKKEEMTDTIYQNILAIVGRAQTLRSPQSAPQGTINFGNIRLDE